MEILSEVTADNLYRCIVKRPGGVYQTDSYEKLDQAELAAREWIYWFNNAADSKASSIYYILAIPDTWAGPSPGAHRYSGLRVKIGIARNVRKRLQNLKTGSPAKLVVHALEPGDVQLEKIRHAEFADDRESGEWFKCSETLQKHLFRTWYRNNLLPPEHRLEVIWLQERIDAYVHVRELMGAPPEMVNPSLNDTWQGNIFIDLAYGNGFISRRPVKKGAYPVRLGKDGRIEPANCLIL